MEVFLAFIVRSFFSHTIRPKFGKARKIVNKILNSYMNTDVC